MGNKKGVVGYVAIIITFTIGALLLANLFIPQTTPFDTLTTTSENIVYATSPNAASFTLTNDEISSVSLNGSLVSGTNFSITDADNGIIQVVNASNGTYAVSYSYEPDGYSDDSSTRAIGGILALAGIVGLLYFVFRGFGLV